MKEDMIVNIIGASGSGKTTVAKELEKKGYNIIHSYTNREPRGHDEWGHTFISDDGFTIDTDGLVGQQNGVATNNYGKIIALRELYGNIYFATKEQYLDKGVSIYVVDPIGANQVKENVDSVPVVTIFLNADEKTRKERLLRTRCPKQAMDRIKDDRKIFKSLQCDYVIDANRELILIVRDIVDIIRLEESKMINYLNGGISNDR